MTTILATHETDGVPAPSDFELEPRRSRVNPAGEYTFNWYCRFKGLGSCRMQFHDWLTRKALNGEHLAIWKWDTLWADYTHADERATHADALT